VSTRWFRYEEVDSTSERAFTALAAGTARDGDVHLARAQRSGRGRLGRRWLSPAGEGLYLSTVLLPGPPPHPPAALTLAAGLAVRDAVEELGAPADELRVDWPNDVQARGAKLAGVLVETRGLDPAAPHYVVGVGLNVRQRRFPPELVRERAVTSLALLDVETDPERAAAVLVPHLRSRIDQIRAAPERLAGDYLAATGLRGLRVAVESGRATTEGTVEALGLDGLGLRLADGSTLRLALEHVRGLAPAGDAAARGIPPPPPPPVDR